MNAARTLAGVDFTSRPTRRKPIVVAFGHLADPGDPPPVDPGPEGRRPAGRLRLRLDRVATHDDLAGFARWLAEPGCWLGAFDLPFGLPRELVVALGWPLDWPGLILHYAGLSRDDIRRSFAAFCDARPVGRKFAHRAVDASSGSSPSMKWVNPPVALMLHAGVPLLLDAGVHLPGLHAGDPDRIALEGYPGLLARELIGRRSYKNDTRRLQTAERRTARDDLLSALESGRGRLEVRLEIDPAERRAMVDDPSADRLDAVLCLVQAAWASRQPNHGFPAQIDPLEGWTASAPHLPARPAVA